jgi:uncharacterized protein YbdZ (MbtH family)
MLKIIRLDSGCGDQVVSRDSNAWNIWALAVPAGWNVRQIANGYLQ